MVGWVSGAGVVEGLCGETPRRFFFSDLQLQLPATIALRTQHSTTRTWLRNSVPRTQWPVRAQVQEAMAVGRVRLVDVFREMDRDGTNYLDTQQLYSLVQRYVL